MRNAQGAATPNPASFEDGAYWRAYAEEQQRLAQERKQEEYAAQVKQAEDALSWEQMQNIRRAVYAKMEYDSETMPVDEAARSAWMAEGRDITERYIHAKALLEELGLPPALLTALEQEYNATVRRTSTQQEAEAAAEQHPILASGLTVVNNLASGVLGGFDLAWQNARNNLGLGAGIGNWLDSRAKAAQSGAITATGSPAQETATPETPLSQQPKGEAPKSFAQRMSDWLDSRAEAAQAGEITATGDPTYIESELTPDELRWPWQIALGQKLADGAQTGAGAVGEAIGTLISGERFYNVWSNFGDILFNNIVAGLTDTGDDLMTTVDLFLPDRVPQIVQDFSQSVHDANDIWTQKAQNVNEAAEVENIGALLQMFGSMIPAMIVSKLKAAPSAGGTPTPGSQAGKTAAASDVLQQLTKDPNFWLDMATEFGPSYKQAAQNGMDDWLAYLYAAARGMTSGLMEDLDLPELASEVLP